MTKLETGKIVLVKSIARGSEQDVVSAGGRVVKVPVEQEPCEITLKQTGGMGVSQVTLPAGTRETVRESGAQHWLLPNGTIISYRDDGLPLTHVYEGAIPNHDFGPCLTTTERPGSPGFGSWRREIFPYRV